jgi:hypothetical protein
LVISCTITCWKTDRSMTPLHKIVEASAVAHTWVAAMDIFTVGSAVLVGTGVIVAVAGTNVRVAVGDGNKVGVCCTSSAWVGFIIGAWVGCTPHAQRVMTSKQIRKKRCILFYSNPSKSIPSRLTARVSCGGWEGRLAIETGKSPKPEKCLKNAGPTHRQLHAVLAGI